MPDYVYNYTYLPPLAMVDQLPAQERPSVSWLLRVVHTVLRIAENRMASAASSESALPESLGAEAGPTLHLEHLGLEPLDLTALDLGALDLEAVEAGGGEGLAMEEGLVEDLSAGAKVMAVVGRLALRGIFDPFAVLENLVGGGAGKGRPVDVGAYAELFRTLPIPVIAPNWQADEVFGALRVAGYNPLLLRRVRALPDLPLSEAHVAAAGLQGDSLEAARAEGRMYVVDHAPLAGLVFGNVPAGPKYGGAPLSVFIRPRGSGALAPVAIRTGPTNAWPTFGRADGECWLRAKVLVNCADANHHELYSHLAGTHLVVEPFCIATPRCLPAGHPVRRLLGPHLVGTLFINDSAQKTLLGPGKQVDQELAGTITSSRAVAVQAALSVDFEQAWLPNALAARDVEDPQLDYPYRDDARAIWSAIHTWVGANVSAAYVDDAAIVADASLAAWAAELAADNGARLASFGEGGERGRVRTRAWLTNALTMVIFTASAQHAAVNFAQASLMTYSPAVAGGLFRAPPVGPADVASNPLLDYFPPMELATLQLEFLTLLGSTWYSRLGDYDRGYWNGTGLEGALSTFQATLSALEGVIEARNALATVLPYPLLLPSKVPQSINI